jgi:hypothetical protein
VLLFPIWTSEAVTVYWPSDDVQGKSAALIPIEIKAKTNKNSNLRIVLLLFNLNHSSFSLSS